MNRKIIQLAIPNILSNISIPLLGLVDTSLMGHQSKYHYLAGIALGNLIFNLVFWSLGFLRMGTVGFASQAFGANDKKAQYTVLYQALIMAAFFSILFILFREPILNGAFDLVRSSGAAKGSAADYFLIKVWASPAILGILVFSGWFIGMQNAVYPMIIAVFTNVLNIALSSILVLKFDLAVEGSAYGTVISQFIGLALAFYLFIRSYGFYSIGIKIKQIIRYSDLKRFLSVNLDIFIRTLCIIAVISYFTIGSANKSDVLLATNTVLFQFFIFFSYFLDGFANAAESLVGESIGAKNKIGLLKNIRLLFIWGFSIAIVFTSIYYLFGTFIIQMITNQKEVIQQANALIKFVYLIPIVSFSAFIWDGIYIGATASKAMRNAMLLSAILFFGTIYIPTFNTISMLWVSFLLFTASRTLFLGLFFKKSILNQI